MLQVKAWTACPSPGVIISLYSSLMTCKFRHDKMHYSYLITTTWLNWNVMFTCQPYVVILIMSTQPGHILQTVLLSSWCLLQLQYPAKISKPQFVSFCFLYSFLFIYLSCSIYLQLCSQCFYLPLSCINTSICSSVSLSLQPQCVKCCRAAHQVPSASCSWFSTVDSSTELSSPGRVQRQLIPPKCVFLWAGLCWPHCVLYVSTVCLLWCRRLVVESPIFFCFVFPPVCLFQYQRIAPLCLMREIPIDTNIATL